MEKSDMMKKHVKLFECKTGEIIADDIFSDKGILIIPKNAPINNYVIYKLINLGIHDVTIYNQEDIDNKGHPLTITQLKSKYENYVTTIKDVLNELASGKELDFEKAKSLSNSIYLNITSNFNLIQCINNLKNTDEYTFTHSINVSIYAMLLSRWLDLNEKDVENAVLSGILHDIGKAKIPKNILNKKGPLSTKEFDIIKTHTLLGYNIIKNILDLNHEVKKAILLHHEKDNGKGYPLGLVGSKLNIYTKIISVADVYDALTSNRCYKKKITPFDCFRQFQIMGIGHFDIKVMLTFLYNIANYYIGSKVVMSNGEIGEVVFIVPNDISKPIVRIEDRFIDLCTDNTLKIVDML